MKNKNRLHKFCLFSSIVGLALMAFSSICSDFIRMWNFLGIVQHITLYLLIIIIFLVSIFSLIFNRTSKYLSKYYPLIISGLALLMIFNPVSLNREFWMKPPLLQGKYIDELSVVYLTLREGSMFELEEIAVPFHQHVYQGKWHREDDKLYLYPSDSAGFNHRFSQMRIADDKIYVFDDETILYWFEIEKIDDMSPGIFKFHDVYY